VFDAFQSKLRSETGGPTEHLPSELKRDISADEHNIIEAHENSASKIAMLESNRGMQFNKNSNMTPCTQNKAACRDTLSDAKSFFQAIKNQSVDKLQRQIRRANNYEIQDAAENLRSTLDKDDGNGEQLRTKWEQKQM